MDEALTVLELSARLHLSPHAIYRRIETFHVHRVGTRPSPRGHKRYSLYSLSSVLVATKRRGRPRAPRPVCPSKEGVTSRDLAEIFGVSPSTVRHRLKRRGIHPIGHTWKAYLFPPDALERCRRPVRARPHGVEDGHLLARLDAALGIAPPGRLYELAFRGS